MANIADSILADTEHGQGMYMPRKKDPLFLKRMIDLDQDAKMKIATLNIIMNEDIKFVFSLANN